MSAKGMCDDTLQDILIIENPQDIRLLFSEKHNAILKLVTEREMSISDIARSLNINPGSVHYHLKELEKHKLVRQVRDEIKGGIIKKYYRAAAKRILFDSPDFNRISRSNTTMSDEYISRLIRSIEYLGFHLPDENMDDAKDLLIRYDKRIKEIFDNMDSKGQLNIENGEPKFPDFFHMILHIKTKDDPELGRIYGEFDKLFLRYE